MRDIKFRGKRVDNGEWVYWNEYGECAEPFICKTGAYGYISKLDIIPETVGQYTGIKDRKRTKEFPHGQEIYEGDTCRNESTLIGEVVFRKSTWVIRWRSGNYYPLGDFVKVIGNIHSNLSLLEVEQ